MLAASFALGAELSIATADGGTVRYSGQRGTRLVAAFTDPAPPATGIVDVSVLPQDAESGEVLTDVPIIVRAELGDTPTKRLSARATTEAATNKLLRAARLEFAAL